MNMRHIGLLLTVALLLALVIPAGAQDVTPSVTVSDQISLNGSVVIESAVSDGPGFIVIHADNGEGGPGPVIGHAPLNPGDNFNISVDITATQATPTLFAMLHADTGEVGVYEFGTVEGADGPVRDADGNVITPSFNVDIINVSDQRVGPLGNIVIASITAQADGFMVIHNDNGSGGPGPVAGFEPVRAGTTANVLVDVEEPTALLFPMLHVDTGEAGVYEFGTVEGADGPVRVNDRTAVTTIWTLPHLRVDDQVLIAGDGRPQNAQPTLVADSVLADENGFLVVHADGGNAPGPVIGYTPVRAGTNLNVEVALDVKGITPVVWPMLHVDTGEPRVYEFGTVEGADGPVRDSFGNVVVIPVNIAPSIVFEGELGESSLVVNQAMIDAPGWLAIHANDGGSPGPVIGHAPLRPGVNSNIVVVLDPAAAGDMVFPMLHYDTNNNGIYEFGAVEGADGPVRVDGAVVVGPLQLAAVEITPETTPEVTEETTEEPTPEAEVTEEPTEVQPTPEPTVEEEPTAAPTEAMAGCTVSAANVNMRGGPGTNYEVRGSLTTSATAVGQAQGADGFIWWQLADGNWVRSDVVTEEGDCESLPVVAAPPVPEPAVTEEPSA